MEPYDIASEQCAFPQEESPAVKSPQHCSERLFEASGAVVHHVQTSTADMVASRGFALQVVIAGSSGDVDLASTGL